MRRGRPLALFRVTGERVENDLNGYFISHSGIDHQVKTVSSGPVEVEILVYEGGAVSVHNLGEFQGFLLTLPGSLQASHPFLKRRVNENMKGVGPLAQIISRPSADNHAVARRSDFRHELLHDFTNAFRIDHLQ